MTSHRESSTASGGENSLDHGRSGSVAETRFEITNLPGAGQGSGWLHRERRSMRRRTRDHQESAMGSLMITSPSSEETYRMKRGETLVVFVKGEATSTTTYRWDPDGTSIEDIEDLSFIEVSLGGSAKVVASIGRSPVQRTPLDRTRRPR
ncbi:hypothetical protein [Sorangium sp. So ce394]|uniref:hypothetical protein n=1 Tax=Sorangium sp. So ce394 TaxID=3133310 RepID=UPI003F5B0944